MLHPAIQAYKTHAVSVGHGHRLYVEECGNPEGLPVVVIHGGPGSGCPPQYRCFFDPQVYRIVLFDQRGADRSEPFASLEHNNTENLIQDMEVIREQLGIQQWVLFGGSWGSTLALAYAQAHATRCLGFILRGIFFANPADVHWMYAPDGFTAQIYPDHYEDFIKIIPESERGDVIQAYYQRLTSEDEVTRMAAAKAWSLWEGRGISLLPNESAMSLFTNTHTAFSIARIECHFFAKDSFLKQDCLLKNVGLINHLPCIIVHGRYDMLCKLKNAWDLHQAWPQSELHIIPDAGHSALEPGITRALVQAAINMANKLT